MKTIFTVTTIHILEPDSNRCNQIRIRNVGWFETLEDAHNITTDNYGDIHENGRYNHVVIEEKSSGLYSVDLKEWWYIWNNGYTRVKKPKCMRHVCNFGIG